MKTYSRQPEAKSDTAQPKASRQASAHDVLQAYKDRTVQRQEIDEDELLQGQFSDTAQLLQDEGSKLLERGNEDKLRQKLAEELKIKDKGHSRHKGSYDPEGDSPEKILTNLTYPCFDPPAKYAEGEAVIQREEIDEEELLQGKFDTSTAQREEIPSGGGKANLTGMPDNLKSGIESLSGYSMDDVRVHYNSSKPAQLQALAYAQGTDIHIAPGQEQHLPHEAWHVVQQKQGRVQPTTQLQGVNVNDNEGLEKEADVMGGSYTTIQKKKKRNTPKHFTRVTQLAGHGNVVVLNNNWVAKLTTEREANAYTFLRQANNNQNPNAINNIQQLIPGVLQILPNAGGLNPAAQAVLNVPNPAWLTRWQANMAADQRIIIMENNITGAVDGGYAPAIPVAGAARSPQTFDIKIGNTTVSKEELTQRGHPKPTSKKNKLRIADMFTGSKGNGYRFCDGNQDELRDRLPAPPDRALCIAHICQRLQAIRDYVNGNSTTFVAASVLITIRDDGAIVKLIDLDHPMININRVHQPQDNLTANELGALQFGQAKFLKYQANFVRGMDSLIQMIQGL